MPLNTENPYNSAFGLEPEQNKLLNAINASKLRDEKATPDEFAMSNYRGPSFKPKGRILPTFKETGQGITAIGGAVAGMALGGIAEIGNYINRKLGIDDVPEGSSLDYWQNKLAYMPTEPTAQRAVQAFNLPFEGLRFVADKVGHGVQDTALRLGINEKDAADLGAIIALGAEFKVLVFTNKGFKKAKGFVGIKTKSVLGKINEIFNKGADEVTIKQAVSDLKNAFKEEVPIENLSEVQKMALDQLTKENEVPIIDYMEHIQELSSEGIVKGLTEKKKVTKRAKKTKVKADEMKTGDVSAATEIIKETEKNKLVPTTDNIELTPSVYSPSDNYFSKPELRSNRTYVWRSMGSSEYNKLMTGQKRYSEGTGKGNFFASVPESASQFKGPGKYLVEFKATATDEGLIKGSNVGPEHVTRIWKYSPSKKVWNEIKIEEYTTKERNAVTIKNIVSEEPVVESKLNIPELNSTEDSIAFSKVATKEQLAEVERLREVHGKKAIDLLDESRNIEDKTKRMDVMNQAMEESVKSQLYREVIEAKNEPERFGQIVKELPTTEEIPKPKITKADKANVVAKKHGIEFISEEAIEELVGEKGTPVNVPHYQFFDPITGEYFLTRSPSSKVVAEELATLRELRNVNDSVNKKLTFGDFNREANDIISGKSKTKPEDFLTTLREFTENISEDEIGPGKRFETTVDVIEHTDMGREFSSRFRREMIKRGKMEEPGTQLNMMIPINEIPDLVRWWYKIGKQEVKNFGEMFRDRELWSKTGFWLGKDGKWRYEIDDSKFRNHPDKGVITGSMGKIAIQRYLTDVIDYPELFKAVPSMKNTRIIYDPNYSNPGAYYQTGDIIFLKRYADKSSLIHEIQHAVNEKLKAFEGGNVTSEKTNLIRDILTNIIEDDKVSPAAKFDANKLLEELKPDNTFQTSAKLVADQYKFNIPKDSVNNLIDLDRISYGNYAKLPGEMEARLASKRMDMTPEQRKQTPPWETLEKMTKEEFHEYSEGIGSTLYSGLPIHLAKDIVKDLNNIFKTVYRGISERVSVKGLKPEDAKVYEKMKNDHEATLTSSEQRGVFEIGKDLETLEDFRANEKFTIDKLKALQLLESDAKRLKQPFDDYLAELGFTPEQVSRAMSESKKIRNKIEPLDETQPINVEVQNTNNPIVKQRQWKGKDKSIITAPPIYADDIRMMENAVDLSPQVGFKSLGTMIRIFEDAGLKPIYNMWREADAVVVREGVAVDNFLKDLTNRYKINRKNRQNIITYAYQQQEGGMRILEANKIKPVKLTPDEMSAYSEMRAMYEDYFERINAVRRSIGREPIKKVDDYFTFARVINNLQREGIINNLIREDATMIMNQYTHFKSTPFRFARNRTGGLFNPELDAFKVFKMYSNTASKHINISPVAAKVNELTNTRLPLSDGSGSVQYSVIKPNTAKFLNDWSDFISGKPVVSKWPGWVGDKGLRLLRKNIGWATLQWNVRSILIQPAAIQNSITELGLKYVSEGFIDNLNPSMRKMAMEKSNHLLSRIPETEINDWAYLGKIWKAGFKPMQWTDLETARTTWLGAYKFGKEVHGLSGKELINFADDTVVRTQGSAGAGDIAAIQRSEMGKALTMFQTFTINNWDFITKDVLGLKGLKVTRPVDFQKVMRLVLSITAINILYEDLLGIPSPNPRPIKNVIDGVSKGKNFGQVALSTTKELLEPVPIIGGSFKYEKQIGGPVFELLSETGKKFTNESIQKDWMEILSMASGIPGTRQVIKYYKGQKRGEGFMGSLLGTYSEEQGSTGRPSRSGRSSRGSR